jgi:CheY-like chemotaxis protein
MAGPSNGAVVALALNRAQAWGDMRNIEVGVARRRVEGIAIARVPATRVLVVEDDPGVVYILCGMLTAHGYEVCHAPHSMAAFHMLVTPQEALPHVVILDIGLPGVRGVAVLEFLRITLRSDLPVVVLTGVATPEEEERLKELGVSAFLRKPTPASTILSAVAEAAGGRASALQHSRVGREDTYEQPKAETSPLAVI